MGLILLIVIILLLLGAAPAWPHAGVGAMAPAESSAYCWLFC